MTIERESLNKITFLNEEQILDKTIPNNSRLKIIHVNRREEWNEGWTKKGVAVTALYGSYI